MNLHGERVARGSMEVALNNPKNPVGKYLRNEFGEHLECSDG
jgi:hypothetical protein